MWFLWYWGLCSSSKSLAITFSTDSLWHWLHWCEWNYIEMTILIDIIIIVTFNYETWQEFLLLHPSYTHPTASATTVKRLGADLRPSGRAWSMETCSSQHRPKRHRSWRWTGTILYTLLRSILSNSVLRPINFVLSPGAHNESGGKKGRSGNRPRI